MTAPTHIVNVPSHHVHSLDDPRRLALIVVDMQNHFVAPGSYVEGVVPVISGLVSTLRQAGATIVWTRQTTSDEAGLVTPDWFKNIIGPDMVADFTHLVPGDQAHAVHPDLGQAADDVVIDKYRPSAFLPTGTGLDQALRARGIDTIAIAGAVTNYCCQSTARDALMLDYRVFFLSDATAGLDDESHNATLADLRNMMFFDLRTSADLLSAC